MVAEVSHSRMKSGTSQLSTEVEPVEKKGKSSHTRVKVLVDTEMVHYLAREKIRMVTKPISQQCIEVKLLRATHLPAWHARIVQAQMTTDDMRDGELYMLEPGKCLSRESQVIVSTFLVQPNHEGHFKVLI